MLYTGILGLVLFTSLVCKAEDTSMLAESTCVEEDNILLRCNLDRRGDVYFYPTHNEDLLRMAVEKLEGFRLDMTNLPNVDYIHVMFGAGSCNNLLGISKTVTLAFNEMPPLHCSSGSSETTKMTTKMTPKTTLHSLETTSEALKSTSVAQESTSEALKTTSPAAAALPSSTIMDRVSTDSHKISTITIIIIISIIPAIMVIIFLVVIIIQCKKRRHHSSDLEMASIPTEPLRYNRSFGMSETSSEESVFTVATLQPHNKRD